MMPWVYSCKPVSGFTQGTGWGGGGTKKSIHPTIKLHPLLLLWHYRHRERERKEDGDDRWRDISGSRRKCVHTTNCTSYRREGEFVELQLDEPPAVELVMEAREKVRHFGVETDVLTEMGILKH